MSELKVTNPEVFKNSKEYLETLKYFDEFIDDKTKSRLDSERDRTYLGHGAYGIAHDVTDIEGYNPSGRVVEKLTREQAEIDNAEYLLDNQSDDPDFPIAKVYHVETLKRSADAVGGVGRIFLEYITPVDMKMAVLYDMVDMGSMSASSLDEEEWGDILNFAYISLTKASALKWVKNKQYSNAFKTLMKEPEDIVLEKLKSCLLLMIDLESRLAKYGLRAEDVHGRNLGMKNGILYIIDLGSFSLG